MRPFSFLRALVVACVAGALTMSALSPATATMAAKGKAPTAWAASVCTIVGDWIDAIDSAATKAETTTAANAKAAKKTLTKLLDQALKATDSLVAKVKKAGVPDVPDGKSLASILRQQYQQLAKSLKGALKTLKNADASDPTAFGAAARAVEDAFESAFEQTQAAFNIANMLDADPLVEAFLAEAACDGVTG